jgi:hypothetical protein
MNVIFNDEKTANTTMITRNRIHEIRSAWRKYEHITALEGLVRVIQLFFKKDKDMRLRYRDMYDQSFMRGEKVDVYNVFRSMVKEVDPDYEACLTDTDIEYMHSSFLHIINSSKRKKYDAGWRRKLARDQNWICPCCMQPLPQTMEGVELDHERAFCTAGDYLGTANLRAVHKDCNQSKHQAYMAKPRLLDYLDF